MTDNLRAACLWQNSPSLVWDGDMWKKIVLQRVAENWTWDGLVKNGAWEWGGDAGAFAF